MNTYISRKKATQGFTIVELIVIVAVLAILVGVTIVGYGQWRVTTTEKALQSDLKMFVAAMEDAKNFGSGYPSTVPSSYKPSDGITISILPTSYEKWYCATATSTSASSAYYVDSTDNIPKKGKCQLENRIMQPQPDSSASLTYTYTNATSSIQSYSGIQWSVAYRTNTSASALYIGRTANHTIATAKAGEKHTIMFKIRGTLNLAPVTVAVGVGGTSSTDILPGTQQTLMLNGGIIPFKQVITVPSGYDGQKIFINISVPASPQYGTPYTFNIADVMWVKGVYNGDYKDGNSSGWMWTGGANLSVSRAI